MDIKLLIIFYLCIELKEKKELEVKNKALNAFIQGFKDGLIKK